MTITLNTKEFDEAVLLWLKEQGFSTDRFSISTKLTVGRGDLGAGTRMEVTLDPITITPFSAQDTAVFQAMKMEDVVFPTLNKPSFSRGHADE
jgi:hypothetical protein